jgi:hypothetical protein
VATSDVIVSNSEAPVEEFDRVRERAIEALGEEALRSVYVGVIDAAGDDEFYFGNADKDDLQRLAVTQPAMMTRVLADQSDLNPESIGQLAAERAKEMDTHR